MEEKTKKEVCYTCRNLINRGGVKLDGKTVCAFCYNVLKKPVKRDTKIEDIINEAEVNTDEVHKELDILQVIMSFLANAKSKDDLDRRLTSEWERIIKSDSVMFFALRDALQNYYTATLINNLKDLSKSGFISSSLKNLDGYYPAILCSQIVHLELSDIRNVPSAASFGVVQHHLEDFLNNERK